MTDLLERWDNIKDLHADLNPELRVDGKQKAVLMRQSNDQGWTLEEIIKKSKTFSTNEPRKYYQQHLKDQKARLRAILELPQKKTEEDEGPKQPGAS